jgi:acyl carrier protein
MNLEGWWIIVVLIILSGAFSVMAVLWDEACRNQMRRRDENLIPREQVAEIIAEVLGVNVFEVVDDKKLEDLGANEINKAELVIALENQMGIEISEEEVQAIEKVKDLIEIVEKEVEARV